MDLTELPSYGAFAYTDKSHDPRWYLANIPDEYALRIDLDYATGSKTVLIYDETPSQREQADLMLKLQMGAKKYGFTVTRTDFGREPINAPALG